MSFILIKDNIELAKYSAWNPLEFSKFTNTSYPKDVDNTYTWENDGYWLGWVNDSEEEILTQINSANENARFMAYRNESDPLFFKAQRGEITQQEWLDKINEIKTRFPNTVI
jgi:hypothetical protein